MSTLRKGKTKSTLESAINSALLAVEIYNKPRTPFRVEGYITNMIIAWTRLFHAFYRSVGTKYYYKESNGRYVKVDGEKKSWELKTCVSKYPFTLDEAVRQNLDFFIRLRNKVEHRHINRDEIGPMIFGECQALLFNFENFLTDTFGLEYALRENLAFSLQFSRSRNEYQNQAIKKSLSSEAADLKRFIEDYRTSVDQSIFDSQDFSVKLIHVPKVSNTNRNDIAIEFVKWNSLSEADRKAYDKLTTIIKPKIERVPALNVGMLKPKRIIELVNNQVDCLFNSYDHTCLTNCLKIRAGQWNGITVKSKTNAKYCHYDVAHNDYVYEEAWVAFLVESIKSGNLVKSEWRQAFKEKRTIDIGRIKRLNSGLESLKNSTQVDTVTLRPSAVIN